MDRQEAQQIYGGPWYHTADGGVIESLDPLRAEDVARVVGPIREHLHREIAPEARVLDLGCATGRYSFVMEEMGAIVTGLDCVDWSIAYAQGLATRWQRRCMFVVGDFDHLPFAPDSFDLALFPQNIVETSYRQMERLVEQLSSILVRGGKLCLWMRDNLITALAKGNASGYDPATGVLASHFRAGEYEPVPYNCCFWTVGFARHVVERHFTMLSCEPVSDGFWLVFTNNG